MKYFLQQNSCFFIFGFILGRFNLSLIEIFTICALFSASIVLIDFKYQNPQTFSEHFMSSVFDNLYCIVFACIMTYVNADIAQTLFYGAIVIVFVLIRVNTRKENLIKN